VDGAGAEVLQTTLLELKRGDRALEGGLGHEGEVGGSVPEVLVEAGGESGEEERVADREAEVQELVRDRLEAQAVGVEGLVMLRCAKNSCCRNTTRWNLLSVKSPLIFVHTV
jgi:hypothetical protein